MCKICLWSKITVYVFSLEHRVNTHINTFVYITQKNNCLQNKVAVDSEATALYAGFCPSRAHACMTNKCL